jgi:hypothetical protein
MYFSPTPRVTAPCELEPWIPLPAPNVTDAPNSSSSTLMLSSSFSCGFLVGRTPSPRSVRLLLGPRAHNTHYTDFPWSCAEWQEWKEGYGTWGGSSPYVLYLLSTQPGATSSFYFSYLLRARSLSSSQPSSIMRASLCNCLCRNLIFPIFMPLMTKPLTCVINSNRFLAKGTPSPCCNSFPILRFLYFFLFPFSFLGCNEGSKNFSLRTI